MTACLAWQRVQRERVFVVHILVCTKNDYHFQSKSTTITDPAFSKRMYLSLFVFIELKCFLTRKLEGVTSAAQKRALWPRVTKGTWSQSFASQIHFNLMIWHQKKSITRRLRYQHFWRCIYLNFWWRIYKVMILFVKTESILYFQVRAGNIRVLHNTP